MVAFIKLCVENPAAVKQPKFCQAHSQSNAVELRPSQLNSASAMLYPRMQFIDRYEVKLCQVV